MDIFFYFPRYPFTRAAVGHAPEEPGLVGLFDKNELVYLGHALSSENHNIRKLLLLHQEGALGACTMNATHYTWEITTWSAAREIEVRAQHFQKHRRDPRCIKKATK
jgi:hypothetical protein